MTLGAGESGTHYRQCTLCEASCGLAVEVADNRVVSIRGDEQDPLSRGYLCPKGLALQDLQEDPDRLTRPLIKQPDGSFAECSWDEALDLVADRLAEIARRDGGDAVAMYLGNPITHSWATVSLIPGLLSALGTRNRFSANTVDQQPQHLLAYLLFGNPLLLPVPDIDRTQFFLCVGGNPAVSNGSIMTAPDMRRRLAAVRERGGRVVVLDPRRSETARLADEYLPVRPGADVFLLGALVHTLFDEGLARPGRVAAFTDGVDEVRRAVAGLAPEAVADRCGVPAGVIRRLAREFAAAPSAVAYGRVGVTQSVYGTTAYWFLHCLNLLTGNLDQAGGAMFARPAFDLPALSVKATDLVGYDRWRSRVSGHPEFAAELPSALLAEEILTPGPGRIRGLVLYAGNPVLSVPDGRAVERALGDLEFCASVDFYLNESNRHADVILPPVPPLERDEFDVVFPSVSVRNWARWNPAVLRRPAGARDDAELLLALTERVHARLKSGARRAAALAAVRAQRRLMPRRYVDLVLRIGPWGLRRGRGAVSLAALERHPHGLDLGALEPALPRRLFTPRRRIQLAPELVLADIPRVMRDLQGGGGAPDGYDLLLIGRRHLRGNNSWMHNLPRLAKGRDRCTLLVHPEDARSRGLADGDAAELASAVGAVVVAVEVTDAVMPGVVSLPHGYGHDRGAGWSLAARQPGVSANDVTDATRYDPLSGNAAVQGTPVSVRRSS